MTSKAVKRLQDCFLGQLVVFYLKDMNISATNEEGEHLQVNGMAEGFVVDIDENFYFLGDEQGNINQVISHDVIAMVEVGGDKEGLEAFLGMPTDEEMH